MRNYDYYVVLIMKMLVAMILIRLDHDDDVNDADGGDSDDEADADDGDYDDDID